MNRLFITSITLLIIIAFSNVSFGADKVSEKKEELQQIYTKLEKQRSQLKKTRIKEKNVLDQINYLNNKISKNRENLNYSKYLVQKRSDELVKIKKELISAEYRLDILHKDFYQRLREVYKSSDISWLEFLLNINDFTEFINDTYGFEKLIKQDIILIEKIKKEKEFIEDSKVRAQNKKKKIEYQASLIVKEKQKLEKNRSNKQKLKKLLAIKRRRYEKEIKELERNSKQIEAYIKNLLTESRDIVSTGSFVWPVKGWISSRFGNRKHPIFKTVKFHSGIDIAAPRGRSIKASDSGVVIYSGRFGGYGKTIIIDHGKSISTVYAHQSRLYVRKGQKVDKGQVIGLVGSTGYSTGPHLHFEVRIKGKVYDPLKYLKKR